MKLTPIDSPRVAQVMGAKTVNAQVAREAAMAKFNEPAAATPVAAPQQFTGPGTTGQSPSQAGAVLDPSNLAAPPIVDALAQTPASEAPPAENLEEARIASHYANLARKEKMLRMREQRINARMAQTPSLPQAAPAAPQFDPSKYVSRDELVSNPFGVLNNLGLSYEQLTQKALEAPSAEDMEQRRQISALELKIKQLEESSSAVKQSFEENQTLARTQAELQIKQDVTRLINSDPIYEVTRANRAAGEVVRLITTVYDQGMGDQYPQGTILDVSEAAMMVENELTDRALRDARLAKIQSRLTSNTAAPKQPNNQQQQTNAPLRTLTNSVGTSTRKQSPRDRALAAFRGEAL